GGVSETTAAAAPPGPTRGEQLSAGSTPPPFAAPLGITFTLHGVTIAPRYPGAMVVTVQNDLASNPTFPDVLIAQAAAASPGAGVGNPQIDFAVADRIGTALSSTALPTSLDLHRFTDGEFRLFNNTAGNVFDILTGTIDVGVVPEPGSLVLAGTAALAGLGAWARRRRARQ